MDFKTLKKLSAACRKAGIKVYKCAEFEITLTDDAPTTPYKQLKQKKLSTQPLISSGDRVDDVESDSLTEDQLLFWSAGRFDEDDKPGAKENPKGS